jgi:hypothetical protein
MLHNGDDRAPWQPGGVGGERSLESFKTTSSSLKVAVRIVPYKSELLPHNRVNETRSGAVTPSMTRSKSSAFPSALATTALLVSAPATLDAVTAATSELCRNRTCALACPWQLPAPRERNKMARIQNPIAT